MQIELSLVRWLVSDAAQPWLDVAWHSKLTDVQRAATLRKSLSPEQTRLVLQQCDLRRRAQAKFAAAEKMFFTPLGLEQATDEVTARYVAARFAGQGPIIDLCCGIGGNLQALALQASTIGVDCDPVSALLAEANLRIHSAAHGSQAIVADATNYTPADVAAWHLDPDRRPNGKRTTQVALHQPGPEIIRRWWSLSPHGAIKLAPAAVLPEDWPDDLHFEWISRARECRQLVVWSGRLAVAPGARSATVLGAGGEQPRTVTGDRLAQAELARGIDDYLFEPDAAVLAAGLQNELARQHGIAAIQHDIAYYTGDRPCDDLALSCFAVDEFLSLDVKQLAGIIRARQIGQLEIKKRGVNIDPETLRRQLKPNGPNSATLLIFPHRGKTCAALARRVTSASTRRQV